MKLVSGKEACWHCLVLTLKEIYQLLVCRLFGRWIVRRNLPHMDFEVLCLSQVLPKSKIGDIEQTAEVSVQDQFGLIANALHPKVECMFSNSSTLENIEKIRAILSYHLRRQGFPGDLIQPSKSTLLKQTRKMKVTLHHKLRKQDPENVRHPRPRLLSLQLQRSCATSISKF